MNEAAPIITPVESLASASNPEGGWGYSPGLSLHLEPTCLAILALADHQNHADTLNRAFAALETQAESNGTYRLSRGRPEAIWPTAVVMFTRSAVGKPVSPKSIERLLTVRGRTIKGDPEVQSMFDTDAERVGWPWADGTFSWVEPTAWAVLALRAVGKFNHPRVVEGARLLLDRAFDSGGVNYGNRKVLEAWTEPIPGPTALMLLALQGSREPRVLSAVQYLMQAVGPMKDLEHLGWAKLALDCYRDLPGVTEFLPRLVERVRSSYEKQVAERRPISVVRRALTVLALSERNPFRLQGDAAKPIPSGGEAVPPSKPEDPPKPGLIEGIKSKFRNMLVRGLGAMRQPPEPGAVHIARAPSYDSDLLAVLKTQFEQFRQFVPISGKRVVLKPNLVEFRTTGPINTDPRFVDAVIALFKAEGAAEIIVAEGPGHWRNVEFLVEESGLGPVLRKHDVRFVDLNHDEPVKVPNLGRTTGLDFLYLTRTVMNAEVFVSLPKFKTHHWAGATLSLKNLFGTVPGICYGWPKNELHWRGIPNSIVDIACTQTPHLAIVDGIIGMEGDGPLAGRARESGLIVMGTDLVAVDATCCRLMKLPAERIPTLVLADRVKLGRLAEATIQQVGESIESMAQEYEWPPQLEKQLMPVNA